MSWIPRVIGRLLAVVLVLAGVVYGVNWAAVALARGALEKAMPAVLGPAQSYAVSLDETTVWDIAHGTLKGIHIEARSLTVPGGPVVDLLSLDVYEAGLAKEGLVSLGRVSGNVVLTDEAVNRYLLQRPGPGSGPVPAIQFGDGVVRLATTRRLLVANVPLVLIGRLALEGRDRLRFVTDHLAVGPVVLNSGLSRLLMARVNPVVDLSGLPFLLDVQQVEVEPGRLLVGGEVHLRLPIRYP